MVSFETFKKRVFPGESGGDYNALYNFQNRDGGLFDGVKVSDMSINEVLDFQGLSEPYANYVQLNNPDRAKSTPAGAFQIVGSTLRMARDDLGLTGNEQFNPRTQDLLAKHILAKQGSKAWPGYEGPEIKPGEYKMELDLPPKLGPNSSNYGVPRMPLGQVLPDRAPELEDEPAGIMKFLQNVGNRVQNLSRDPDYLDQLRLGFNAMTLRPNQSLSTAIRERMADRRDRKVSGSAVNRTVQMLNNMRGSDGQPIPSALQAADLIESYPESASSVLQSFYQSLRKAQTGLANKDYPNGLSVVTQNDGSKKYMMNGVEITDPVQIQQAIQDTIRFDAEAAGTERQAVLNQERASETLNQIGKVQKSIVSIDKALAAIGQGAQSGVLVNFLPDITEASAALSQAMNLMGLDVIGSVTFGALSEGEMRLAMNTAAPRSLAPEPLKEFLLKKREAQVKAQDALFNAARFFSVPGNTLDNYLATQQERLRSNNPTESNIFATMSVQQIEDFNRNNTMTTEQKAQAIARLKELKGN